MAYKGKYKLTKPEKYIGDGSRIWFRSLWELSIMKWLETNPDVIKWSSEVPCKYRSELDGNIHTYYIDFYIQYLDGSITYMECKPKKYCTAPTNPKRKTAHYIELCNTWIVNCSKWKTAKQLCEQNGYNFEIWHEDIIKSKGIKIIT